jgi:PadR family transcriptional regulator AphA
MLPYALLGFLNYGEMTGYDLKQIMDESRFNFWYAKQSQIYTTLKKMEADGWVTSHFEAQEGRPDKRIYSITSAGRNVLMDWLSNPMTELEPRKETFLLKLFFSAPLDKDALLAELRLQRGLHKKKLNEYQTEARQTIAHYTGYIPTEMKDPVMWEATRRCLEMYAEMHIRWLDETINVLKDSF